MEAEKIALTDLLYSTLEIYNILVCNTNFLPIYNIHTSHQDLWGIYARENSFFGIFITHSPTISKRNQKAAIDLLGRVRSGLFVHIITYAGKNIKHHQSLIFKGIFLRPKSSSCWWKQFFRHGRSSDYLS